MVPIRSGCKALRHLPDLRLGLLLEAALAGTGHY